MTFEEWVERIYRDWPLIEEELNGLPGTLNGILGVWLLIAQAPRGVRNLYRHIEEKPLEDEANAAATLPILPPLPVDLREKKPDEILFVVAVALRALERRFLSMSDGGHTRTSRRCRAFFGGEEAFIVAVSPRHRAIAGGQSYRKRALKTLRVLPVQLAEYKVHIAFPEDPVPVAAEPGPVAFGGGLFEEIQFTFETTRPRFFRVTDVTSVNHSQTILTAVKAADESKCTATVFPELCMTENDVSALAGALGRGDVELTYARLIVAGSMHVRRGSKYFNECTILDRYGGEVATHAKLEAYINWRKDSEDIDCGDTITVIATPAGLIAVAICLDFCNNAEPSEFPWLDVDYVLVPSCGGHSTMSSHVEASKAVLKGLKARTFVVQQHHDEEEETAVDQRGYILARESESDPDPSALATQASLTTVRL